MDRAKILRIMRLLYPFLLSIYIKKCLKKSLNQDLSSSQITCGRTEGLGFIHPQVLSCWEIDEKVNLFPLGGILWKEPIS